MSVKSLQRLEAWSRSKDFAVRIYREVLPLLPADERWNLNQQLRRSATSIPANIAEGFGRFYYQDNVRFCYNARGSLEETLSHLVMAHEMNFIQGPLFDSLEQDGEKLAQLISGYIAYLKRSRQGESEPGAGHAVHDGAAEYRIEAEDGTDVETDSTGTALDSQFSHHDSRRSRDER